MQISVQRLYRSFEFLRTGGLKNCRYRGLVSSFHTRNSRRWTPTCSLRNRGRCRGRHSSCWTLVPNGLTSAKWEDKQLYSRRLHVLAYRYFGWYLEPDYRNTDGREGHFYSTCYTIAPTL